MTEKPLFNFRLAVETKQDWEGYIEEHRQYESIAELIRGAVAAEIEGDGDTTIETPALSSDVQEIRDDLDRIKKDVRWLRQQNQDAVDISDLAQAVLDDLKELPRFQVDVPSDVDDSETYRLQARAAQALTPNEPDQPTPSYTAETIAERVNAKAGDVREAISHLQDQFIPITGIELEGQTHYFVEGT